MVMMSLCLWPGSCRLHGLAKLGTGSPQHDFFQPAFRRFEFGFAMALQRLAALVQGDGIFQVDLALLQPRNNGLQFLERQFETQAVNGGGFGGRRNDVSPMA
jgi:hypothetical protein